MNEDIQFQNYAGTDNLILIFNIDEEKFKINRGDQYIFTTSYTVYDEISKQTVIIDYQMYSSLSGKVANYSVDDKK